MSAAVDMVLRRKLLAKVHIAKKELALDDELYRAVVERVTGASSSRDLNLGQLDALIAEFRRLGWKPKTARGQRPSGKPQVRLIWRLWIEMGRAGVADPEWLNDEAASTIVHALKQWQRRGAASTGGGQ